MYKFILVVIVVVYSQCVHAGYLEDYSILLERVVESDKKLFIDRFRKNHFRSDHTLNESKNDSFRRVVMNVREFEEFLRNEEDRKSLLWSEREKRFVERSRKENIPLTKVLQWSQEKFMFHFDQARSLRGSLAGYYTHYWLTYAYQHFLQKAQDRQQSKRLNPLATRFYDPSGTELTHSVLRRIENFQKMDFERGCKLALDGFVDVQERKAQREREKSIREFEYYAEVEEFKRKYNFFSKEEVLRQYQALKELVSSYEKYQARMEPSTQSKVLDGGWEAAREYRLAYRHFRLKFGIDIENEKLWNRNFNVSSREELYQVAGVNFAQEPRFHLVVSLIQNLEFEQERTFSGQIKKYFSETFSMGTQKKSFLNAAGEAIIVAENGKMSSELAKLLIQERRYAEILGPKAEALVEIYDQYVGTYFHSDEQNKKLLNAYLRYSEAIQSVVSQIQKNSDSAALLKELTPLRSSSRAEDAPLTLLTSSENSDNEERLIRILVYSEVAPFLIKEKGASESERVNSEAVISLMSAVRAVEKGGLCLPRTVTFRFQGVTLPFCHVGTHPLTVFETGHRGLNSRL